MKKPLIIGYGNPLREDDGIGRRAAEIVECSLAPGRIGVVQCHQLTPELALEVQDASLVIFLDAARNQPLGEISTTHVGTAQAGSWSHHLTPSRLLSLVENAPPAYAITCGVSSIAWREGLTAQGKDLAAKMAAAALSLLRGRERHAVVPATHTTHPGRRP